MNRILSIMMLLLLGGVVVARAADPKPLTTVHFESLSSGGTAENLRKLLQAEIEIFSDVPFQFLRIVHNGYGDYAYSDLAVRPTVSSSLRLSAKLKHGGGSSKVVTSPMPNSGSSVHHLFSDLIDRTLFHDDRGVYRPLSINACSKAGALARLTVSVDPAFASLDPAVLYRLGVRDTAGYVAKCVNLEIDEPDPASPATEARFKISGATTPEANFLRECQDKRCSGYLLPRREPCVDRGATNPNASSVHKPD